MKKYFEDKKAWGALLKKVMAYDFSWDEAAEKYMALYHSLIREK